VQTHRAPSDGIASLDDPTGGGPDDLEHRLRRALRSGRLQMHYQPVVDLSNGAVVGVEALARWYDDELGAVPPDVFIPVAERTGLIVELGRLALRETCERGVSWSGVHDQPLVMSVNVSPVQLREASFVDDVHAALADSGLPPHRLCLEITETAMVADVDGAAATLQRLRALGVQFALDDFGTGHSSLARLGSYPFDVVKIDRSFVIRMTDGHRDQAVVQAVLHLADAFAMDVIAEGVETQDQRQLLVDLGCERVQGFLFSRPVIPTEAFRLLAAATSLG